MVDAKTELAGKAIGIVVFSFALRADELEPNPCNARLGLMVRDTLDEHDQAMYVVAQWEVAIALERLGVKVHSIVERPANGTYLDSNLVWASAEKFFKSVGVSTVIPVAQPFLQLRRVKQLIASSSDFRIKEILVHPIGFDNHKENLQWWTKGPTRLLLYSVLKLVKST